jgi:hypothetical protein
MPAMWMGPFARWTPPRAIAIAATGAALVGAAGPARAEDAPLVAPLTTDDALALDRGEVVKRPFDPDLPGGVHVGGLSYAVIAAEPADVWRALLDVTSYRTMLPLTMEAREVGRAGDERWVVLRHGVRWASIEYTAHVVPGPDRTVRFWLDPRHPHEVDDAWGFFRVEPWPGGRTLLAYGAVVDLGGGFAGLFFKEKIRRHALETPRLVRRFVEAHRAPAGVAVAPRVPLAP